MSTPKLTPEQVAAFEQLKEVEERLSQPSEGEKELAQEMELLTQESLPKVVQLTINEQGLPEINYQSMTVTEVLGLLEFAKEMLLQRRIGNAVYKHNLTNMLQALD